MPAPNFTGGHFVGETFKRFPHICPGSRCAILSWLQSKPLRLTEREFFDQKSERIVTDSTVMTNREGLERINEPTAGNAAASHCDAGSH
jgi:hypothetical protein